jgi:predicted transposase YbfD/YdcC
MEYITIVNEWTEDDRVAIGRLYAYFQTVPDNRDARGKRYPLAYLLIVIVLAKLAGEQRPAGIQEWIRLRWRVLMKAFSCHWPPVPGLNTIRRTLADAVTAAELNKVCVRFLYEEYGGQQEGQLVIDGKTMRGTIAAGCTQGVHQLTAYLPEEGVALDQEVVANKENELVAAPKLLARLVLYKKVVCGDAMFTQRNLSVQIMAQGGDYLWFVKDNQPTLHEDVQRFFKAPDERAGWSRKKLPETCAHTTGKGHGRVETRTLTAVPDKTEYLNWPGAQQVFKLERAATDQRTNVRRVETVFGLTSLTPEESDAEHLLSITRRVWGIENGLHRRRDTTLQEDSIRMSHPGQAEAMAVLHNFINSLFSKLGFSNHASAIRRFNAAIDRTLLLNFL